jgi:hypothetical protein
MSDKKIIMHESKNIITDISTPISQRDPLDNIVYFQRYIGFDNEKEYIALINSLNEKLSLYGNACLIFTEKISVAFEKEKTDKYESALNNANVISASASNVADFINNNAMLFLSSNDLLYKRVRQGLETILNLYKTNGTGINTSIFINFIIKIICWINQHVSILFERQSDINPKVIYYGSVKKHEAYFLIFLSLIGCDVLIFNADGDGDYLAVDKNSIYSKGIYGSIKKELKYYPSKIEHLEAKHTDANIQFVQNIPVITQHSFDKLETLLILLKKSNDILSEFIMTLTQRVGYCGKPAPIIPTFFCRYTGVPEGNEDNKDEYFNTLYLLDKKLKNNKNGYVKIENHLFVPSTNDLFDLQDIEVKSDIFNEKYISNLVYKISQSKKFYKSGYALLDNTILKALYSMLFLYINNEKCINASKLKNFVYKFVIWLNKYVKDLYKNVDFIETPKALYYGEIKRHEVYFLIFLSQIGCDVLYVSPNIGHDKIIKNIDVNEQYTYLNENSNSMEFESFPVSEKIVRQSTVAFNASQQIDDIIYNADTGLFKPWQFEDYFTKQVTLKTTYDELKLLWKEQSKIRPGFKVENNTVYIPNLFAKINGVNEDINEYWKSFIELSSAKNCLTITEVPFTKITYTNQEMYSCAYLLDKNGLLIKENGYRSKFYKFSYLKSSLQQHIFTKINELIMSKCFIRQIDEKFKLKILMTILTLDIKVLYLLETFDFASEIPKLLIYHNKPDQLSVEDAIVIGFLNIIGMDIVIFTPTNYNNIENHFKPDLFDTFQLPAVNLQLEIPDLSHIDFQRGNKRSLFSKIFNK